VIKAASAAVTIGFSAAPIIALGSWVWCDKKNLRVNTVTALVGGTVTGAIAGAASCLIPTTTINENTTLSRRIALNAALALVAYITAPLMGKVILNYDIEWYEFAVQALGGLVILSVAALVLILCGGLYGTLCGATIDCAPRLTECCPTLFFSAQNACARLTERFSPAANINNI
jgi:hypothetical protein